MFFCRNNGFIIKNNGLGTHDNKICVYSSAGNTPNLFDPFAQIGKLFGILMKKPSSHVHSPCSSSREAGHFKNALLKP